ncbi:unnamed protein product [Periconia digitata]|uniref:Uncharacterized protein n=1 Tax=Periconia digitata TaxID=1303443 RepID=A0A9W4XET3_9PLEO|nr:unnamed protein product [Periconia digitata]
MNIDWQPTGAEVMIGHHRCAAGTKSSSSKIAIFDLDSTLIVAKSGEVKGQDAADWVWWHDVVPTKLRQAFHRDFRIVIITNQGRLTTTHGAEAAAAQPFRDKVHNIFEALDLPVTIYVACANDGWRKPRTRTWEHLVDSIGPGRVIDVSASYMVGDAAGRPNDHSDDDRHFAMNLGIPFQTPEEFFLAQSPENWKHIFDPDEHLGPVNHRIDSYILSTTANGGTPWCVDSSKTGEEDLAPIVLLVGLPGSGKTTFYLNTLQGLGYERIAPQCGTSRKCCEDIAAERLNAQKRVVIDDINHNCAVREPWVALARKQGVRIAAVYFSTPAKLCLHNDAVRALGDDKQVRVNVATFSKHENDSVT